MKTLLPLLLFLACLTLQAQTPPAAPPKSWSPEPLEDSIKKYNKKGDYDRAISFAGQWLEKTKKNPGKDSLDFAAANFFKGDALRRAGDKVQALPPLTKSLAIRKKALGSEHPDVASSLDNLGILYRALGEYAKAETYYLLALEIKEKALGPEHPNVANSLNNLGVLYSEMGEYTKAEPFYLQTLEIKKKALGPEHKDVAAALNNLGNLYVDMGENTKAEPYQLQALEILKKALGKEHPNVATSLNNLGILYHDLGEYTKAEAYLLQSLEILKKALGMEHPDVANLLDNLGILYRALGEYAKAEAYYLQALEIRKKALGPEHPNMAGSLNGLGNLHRGQKNIGKAKLELNQLGALNNIFIKRYFPAMSEQGREDYLKMGSGEREGLLSFWGEEGVKMPELRGELWNHQLFYKGLLLNTSARWKQRIKTSGDKKLQQRFFEWENLQIKISKLFTSTDSTERAGLDSLVQQAEKLEKELSQRSENFGRSEERKARTWKEVQQALKPGEAAIEMVRLRHFGIAKTVTDTSNPQKPTYRVKGLTDTLRYAALILTKTSLQPELVILPQGNDLEEKYYKYYRNSVRLQQKDAESYKQYWQPIGKKLKGIKKVWFSADGVYHKINLNTLKNPATGKFLSEEMDISLLGSTKDLLKTFPDESENRLACLVGNPAFNPGQVAMAGKSRSGPEHSYYFKPDPSMEVAALPGTQQEVDEVAGILNKQGWEVQEFAGAEASEEKVKDSYKPRVMLLSTHGFFRSDTASGSNPLLHSGLLLAGATKTLREGHSGEGEDGILTAYEAMNLNLDNTELVVLSACETGLGEIRNGEGVYGLQRAFQVAGARNLIMSLWKVDDAVTQKLMTSFFRHWLNGKSKQAAFAQAQKEIRAQHPEPYYWGAFVMLGK